MNPFTGWRTVMDMTLFQCGETLMNTRASAERITRLQNRRLQTIMQDAARTPFYQKRFADAGINPSDIKTATALRQMPITTRAEIQSVPLNDRITAGADLTKMEPFATSGSTGHPVQILENDASKEINSLLTLRACTRYGLKPWQRKMGTRTTPPKEIIPNLGERLGLYKRDWFVISHPIEDWIDRIREFRPHCIMGFLSGLRVLAYHLLDEGITDLRPNFVITIGEVADPRTRDAIARAFNAPTYDLYGSWEGGMMAWECPNCEGYHINADWVIVELLEDGVPVQPGEEGDVVITNLHNHDTPFIRYAQGDRAIRHEGASRCSSRLPLLKQICGRTTDTLVGPDGAPFSALPPLVFISSIPGIRLWRLTQETCELMRLEVAADTPLSEAATTELTQKLSNVMMTPIQLQIEYVPDLEKRYGNKFRRVICNVA